MPAASLLASVVFLKIQDFARRATSEQARLRAQLEAVVAVTAAELDPAGRLVLEASDGVAVVVLGDPRGALRLAERALGAGAAGLPLCAGLNHGAVQLDEPDGKGANGKAKGKGAKKNGARAAAGPRGMTGDGIAVAAAVAEFAAPSRLLASRAFRRALADVAPGLEARLAPAGTFTDAGLRTHEVFAPDRGAPRRRSRRYALASVSLAAALLAGGVALRVAEPGQKPFVDAVVQKYHPYWRALVQRVSY